MKFMLLGVTLNTFHTALITNNCMFVIHVMCLIYFMPMQGNNTCQAC